MEDHIHPIFDKILKRREKESLLKQHGCVLWMSGLSGSGKSTIARALEDTLYHQGYLTQLLDGDNLRTGLNNNLGFSQTDRDENIRRAAEAAKLFLDCGVVVICSFISPTRTIRDLARNIIGNENFFEVYVNCSLDECEKRDVKGLYKKARNGEIKNFTGIDAPFEPPVDAAVELKTHLNDIDMCRDMVLDKLYPLIKFK